MNKILITGASGFIGSHLVSFLLEDGEKANHLRLLIPEKSSLDLLKKNFDIVQGDIRNKELMIRAMKGVNTIYHLAAVSGFGGKTYKDYKEVNVDGTQNLLDACRGEKIQKFIFFSTVAVYGLPPWIGRIVNWDENSPKNPTEIYGKSKFEAEKKILQAAANYKLPYVIIRPASVYGPRDKGQLYGLYRAIKNHYFVKIGNGKNLMHFLYVKDLVKGARQAQLSTSKAAEYIFAGKKPTEFNNVIKYVAASINERIPSFYIPKTMGLMLSQIMDLAGNIIGIRSPLFPTRVKVMTTSYSYNIEKARREIGYNPRISFEKGALLTGKWYLKNKWL